MRLRCVLPIFLALLGITFSVGCLILPRFHTDAEAWHDQHKPITDARLKALKPGEIHVQQVLRELGTPSHSLLDGQLLAYSWASQRQAVLAFRIWVCGMKEAVDEGLFESKASRMHHLLLRFDEQGVLREMRIRRGGFVSTNATGISDAVLFPTD
jgi:hypothetical protein